MRTFLYAGLPAAALLALSGCVPAPQPAPEPAPPIAVPAPPPAPAPAPALTGDWRDWPLTPGEWAYRQDGRGSIALFERSGADAELTLRCDRGRGRIYLSRRGTAPAGGASLTVRTSSTLRTIPMLPTGGADPYLAAELGVRDSLLDAIGFSRGRFIVQGGGQPVLVVPAVAEILRVAEDCR